MADNEPENKETKTTEPVTEHATETASKPEPPASTEPATQPAGNQGATVNAYKHARDIAKLEAERDAAKAEAEGYKALKAELDEWKHAQEKEKTDAALKAAGCHDVVAAAARLGEFDGDVEKLKEAAPYLFNSTDSTKKTGGNPKGSPDPDDERTKKMRSIMGLKDKE